MFCSRGRTPARAWGLNQFFRKDTVFANFSESLCAREARRSLMHFTVPSFELRDQQLNQVLPLFHAIPCHMLCRVYSSLLWKRGEASDPVGLGVFRANCPQRCALDFGQKNSRCQSATWSPITHALCLHCKLVFSCARCAKVPTCVLKIHDFFIFSMAKSPGECCWKVGCLDPAMQEAQVAVQAGTQPVARLWSCLLSLLPAADRIVSTP